MSGVFSLARMLSREALVSGRIGIAFPAAAALPFIPLLLPSLDGPGGAAARSSLILRIFSLLAWFFALIAPAWIASPEREWGIADLARARPVSSAGIFCGRAMACAWIVLLWWAVAGLATFAAMEIAFLGPGGEGRTSMRRVFPGEGMGPGGVEIASRGAPAKFVFRGLERGEFPGGAVEGRAKAVFVLAKAGAGSMAAPLRVVMRNPSTGESLVDEREPPGMRRPLSFMIPEEIAFPGGSVEVSLALGPSPFSLRIPEGGVFLLAGGRGRKVDFLACLAGVLALALALSVLSSAASQALSFPVAAVFSAAFGFAGETSAFAGRAAQALLSGSHGHEGAMPEGLWKALLQASAFVSRAFPDFALFCPVRDFVEGYEIRLEALAGPVLAAAALGLACLVAGAAALSLNRRNP